MGGAEGEAGGANQRRQVRRKELRAQQSHQSQGRNPARDDVKEGDGGDKSVTDDLIDGQ